MLLFVALLVAAVVGAPAADQIQSLPGWNGPLPSKMYSGHMYSGRAPGAPHGNMYTHYFFVESERDPKNDPVLMWYNGGPGASSMFGLLVELGPLWLNDDSVADPKFNSTGIPQLQRNAYSWSKTANLLVVDAPPPVGFSYCEPAGPSGDPKSCGAWNDTLTAECNHQFIASWIKAFPEYYNRPCAGVYVPMLVEELLNNPIPGINLKGFAVGDGCMGVDVLCGGGDVVLRGPYYDIEWLHGHGQFSNDLYRTIMKECPIEELHNGNLNPHCKGLVDEMNKQAGGYFVYSLYDPCYDRNVFRKRVLPSGNNVPITNTGYACPGPAMELWLKRADVRQAMHVAVDADFFSGDDGVGFVYVSTEKDVRPIYKRAILETNLNVLVYNGDTDPAINSFETQDIYFAYMRDQNIPILSDWHPWTLDGGEKVAGYVTQFKGQFAYLTIRGSGHMVPEFKPKAASVFITNWLEGKDYPPYVPKNR